MIKSTIVYQNYGTAILLFITGDKPEDAYGQWLSLYNWGATSTEPQDASDGVISCWSTIEKFQRYLFNLFENRLWNDSRYNKGDMDLCVESWKRAKAAFEATQTESFRSINSEQDPYEFGVIAAERPDDDFATAVLTHAFESR